MPNVPDFCLPKYTTGQPAETENQSQQNIVPFTLHLSSLGLGRCLLIKSVFDRYISTKKTLKIVRSDEDVDVGRGRCLEAAHVVHLHEKLQNDVLLPERTILTSCFLVIEQLAVIFFLSS